MERAETTVLEEGQEDRFMSGCRGRMAVGVEVKHFSAFLSHGYERLWLWMWLRL